MKKHFILAAFVLISLFANAQRHYNEDSMVVQKQFLDKSKLFAGGGIELSLFNGTTVLGALPYFGYSLNKYVDVAASFGYIYTSERDYYSSAKLRQNLFAPGAFVRIFPVKFLFAQAQYEHDFVTTKTLNTGDDYSYKTQNNALLVGAGFASGRNEYSNTYYYMSILWDVANNVNSPYKDDLNRAIPIIRAGFNVGLFQGRYQRNTSRYGY